jgi:hypothetical protein
MANVAPLKISNGQIMQFQAGDTISTTIAPGSGGGGGGGATVGSTTIDFGVFPGKSDASVAVTGQASIVVGSTVDAWLRPDATADHTADEHLVETMRVIAGTIVAGTGFTIYAANTSLLNEPLVPGPARAATVQPGGGPDASNRIGGIGTLIWGLWTVSWRWQ